MVPSLEASLRCLRTDHVDLALIHWPSPGGQVPLSATLDGLLEARERGLVRQIGLSNFTVALMREALDIVGSGVLATNQVELSPYLQNRRVAAFAREHGLHLTSYMTLAYGKVLGDPVLQGIAQRHGATVAQVALAWAMQQGHAVIPSSTKREHLASNLKAQSLRLSEVETAAIAKLDRHERQADPQGIAPEWDPV